MGKITPEYVAELFYTFEKKGQTETLAELFLDMSHNEQACFLSYAAVYFQNLPGMRYDMQTKHIAKNLTDEGKDFIKNIASYIETGD